MEIYDIAIIPLIIAVTELAKKLGLPDKFAALSSAVLGVVIGIVYISPENIPEGILVGLAIGLAASGLYSGTKNTVQGIKGQK
jgi:L-cystine uptake protein TcyP (sodium:dicarboxylate symporter family)